MCDARCKMSYSRRRDSDNVCRLRGVRSTIGFVLVPARMWGVFRTPGMVHNIHTINMNFASVTVVQSSDQPFSLSTVISFETTICRNFSERRLVRDLVAKETGRG